MKLSKKISKNLLDNGVVHIFERVHLDKSLKSKTPLRIKLGIDATSPDLHLGHAVILRKLKEFQDLGHKIILIIGDFTAMIGDPSGKSKTRPPLSPKEIKRNMKDYVSQAGKIINIKKAEIHYNSKWLKKLGAEEILKLLSLITANRILERDDFSKRFNEGKSVAMHELLYPILQAYDSVMVKADLEIGGTDQTFNLLMGRELMSKMGMKPQDVLTLPLLEGTDGENKMSKSLGNYIALSDEPNDMFGKIMSLNDQLIDKYFLLCTDLTDKEIKGIKGNPKMRKLRLAREIVKIYHGEKEAKKAQEEFNKVFSKKELPSEIKSVKLKVLSMSISDILVKTGLVESNGQAFRLVTQGGVEVDGLKVTNPKEIISVSKSGRVIKAGKKNFVRII